MDMPTTSDDARQMQRKHIFVVNHDPAFLGVTRLLLQDDH